MSKISEYLQISEMLLLEYTYDTASTKYVKNVQSYVIKDLTGHLMYFMNPEKSNVADLYKSSIMYNAFPNATGDHYFYPGHSYLQDTEDSVIPDIAQKLQDNKLVESIVTGPVYSSMPFDTVRVHIATGYTFADTLGFMISVRAAQAVGSSVLSKDFTIVLQNFVFHKGNMSESVEFNKRPFYMTSRFYDRYIEFQIPSAYYMAVHKYDLSDIGTVFDDVFDTLAIDSGSLMVFDYSEITDDSFEPTSNSGNYIDLYEDTTSVEGTDKALYNQGNFYLTSPVSAEIALNANSDYFNAKLYEDTKNNCIRFYPIWGSVTDDKPMTRTIMNSIENGSIPMSVRGFTDDIDSDLEEFTKIYGEDSRKWIIVNSMNLEYHYVPFLMSDTEEDQSVVRTQKFQLTEDFQDDNDNITSTEELYKFSYRPIVETISGYKCKYINVAYTARLVNRLNGEEVIRYATLDIENAEAKYGVGATMIDVSNLYTWKLFNKNEIVEANVSAPGIKTVTKYVARYFSTNGFVLGDEGTIKLYESDHLYKIQISKKDEDENSIQPYKLASKSNYNINMEYVMTVNIDSDDGKTSKSVDIEPTYSENMDLENGELEFRIPGTLAKEILKSGNKKFIIKAKTKEIGRRYAPTTLIDGKFVQA